MMLHRMASSWYKLLVPVTAHDCLQATGALGRSVPGLKGAGGRSVRLLVVKLHDVDAMRFGVILPPDTEGQRW